MIRARNSKPLSREEDYRDFEERDRNDGWPYSDGSEASDTDPRNKEYGSTKANFDADASSGYIIDNADETGLEENADHTFGPLPATQIDDDSLEAAITDWLGRHSEIDANSFEIRVHGDTVVIQGSVETADDAKKIEALLLTIEQVRNVDNRLRTTSVDSHLPPDA